MDKKTHYKTLKHPKYFGEQDLVNEFGKYEEKIFFISHATEEHVQEKGKNTTKLVKVVYLRGANPFICNSENWENIASACGSKFIEDWEGKPIQIFAFQAIFFGKPGMYPRVRAKSPELEKLTPDHRAWSKAKKALQNGADINDIKRSYQISKEHEKLLIAL